MYIVKVGKKRQENRDRGRAGSFHVAATERVAVKKIFTKKDARGTVPYAISVLNEETTMPRRPDFLDLIRTADMAEERTAHRQTLQDWDALRAALPEINPQFIRETREKLECSRGMFARRLFTNERTLEKWEQGRAKPNAQAAALLLLVRHFPDTLERLRRIACPDPVRRRRRS